MRVEFSEHFWKRFEERKAKAPVKITRELVMETIEKPDLVLPDPYNRNR